MTYGKSGDLAVLAGLENWHQLALAAAVVSHMQPNVALFFEVTEQEGGRVFDSTLALVWEFSAGVNTSIDFARQREKLEAVIPDPEQFDMYGVWPALDGCVALSSLLSACEQFDTEEVMAVFELSQATIEGFIEATGQEQEGQALLAMEADFTHSLMTLDVDPHNRKSSVSQIKALAQSQAQSNIGVSLE